VANIQDLKRRIRSVKNTMQLTKAMKMVAAAKLRRAQERMTMARPYSARLLHVLRSVASRADTESHPLLESHGDERFELLVVTADKGLCGGFNAGIIRAATTFAEDQTGRRLKINAVGKKGRDTFRGKVDLVAEWIDVFRKVEFSKAQEIAQGLIDRFTDGETDRIYLAFNSFKSAVSAEPVVRQLLPIEPEGFEDDATAGDYIYEPSPDDLLRAILPHYVENQVYQALLESAAAEHAARMAAMDAATNNAGELIDGLTLTMNRVRQASITTEIIEVVSGAEALG
jgi:F-type H+-transporting ATPase subunit gamma